MLTSKFIDVIEATKILTCRPYSSLCIVPHLGGLLVFHGEGINWQSSSFMWSDKSELNCGGCNLISDRLLQSTRLTRFLQFNFVERFAMWIDSLKEINFTCRSKIWFFTPKIVYIKLILAWKFRSVFSGKKLDFWIFAPKLVWYRLFLARKITIFDLHVKIDFF